MSSSDVLSAVDWPQRGLRLCQLRLDKDDDDDGGGGGGYGFTVYTGTEPSLGQFVGDVDHQSPADRAGLLTGDRVVEVNGVNVETDSHAEASSSSSSSSSSAAAAIASSARAELVKRPLQRLSGAVQLSGTKVKHENVKSSEKV